MTDDASFVVEIFSVISQFFIYMIFNCAHILFIFRKGCLKVSISL